MNITADPHVLEFLKDHGCGTKDFPLVPDMYLEDKSGVVVGKRITKRIGNKFIVEQVLFEDSAAVGHHAKPDFTGNSRQC